MLWSLLKNTLFLLVRWVTSHSQSPLSSDERPWWRKLLMTLPSVKPHIDFPEASAECLLFHLEELRRASPTLLSPSPLSLELYGYLLIHSRFYIAVVPVLISRQKIRWVMPDSVQYQIVIIWENRKTLGKNSCISRGILLPHMGRSCQPLTPLPFDSSVLSMKMWYVQPKTSLETCSSASNVRL